MAEKTVSYDYKTVRVKREMETMVADSYESLGWEFTNSSASEGNPFYVNLSFKRDRKIKNKIGLLKLQQGIDNSLNDIEVFQRKRKSAGTTTGICIGTLGALAFGGGLSMTLTMTGIGYLIGGIAISLVGVGIAVAAYFISKKVKKVRSENLTPIIEAEIDNLADLCEKANDLVEDKVANKTTK